MKGKESERGINSLQLLSWPLDPVKVSCLQMSNRTKILVRSQVLLYCQMITSDDMSDDKERSNAVQIYSLSVLFLWHSQIFEGLLDVALSQRGEKQVLERLWLTTSEHVDFPFLSYNVLVYCEKQPMSYFIIMVQNYVKMHLFNAH